MPVPALRRRRNGERPPEAVTLPLGSNPPEVPDSDTGRSGPPQELDTSRV
jgi:hypothetical protein